MSLSSFADEMVAAWLNRQDEVLQRSGEPTWSTLADALTKIGQTGLAKDIRRICHDTSHSSPGNHASVQFDPSTQIDTGLLLSW